MGLRVPPGLVVLGMITKGLIMRIFPRVRITAREGGECHVKQSLAAAQDINYIIDRWRRKGEIPVSSGRTPSYGDFSGISDYHACLEQLRIANDEFLALPAKIRQACENDPGKFLSMVFSVDGRKVLDDLGLDPDRAPKGAAESAPVAPVAPDVGSGSSDPGKAGGV